MVVEVTQSGHTLQFVLAADYAGAQAGVLRSSADIQVKLQVSELPARGALVTAEATLVVKSSFCCHLHCCH